MTLLEVLRRATGYLEQHGSGSPRLDAELLLAHSLGLRRLDLYLQFERPLNDPELAPYRELVARRGRGEPVAYLVGHREFMKLDFEVTPDVLVPNPDTEPLVARAIAWLRERGGPVRVADVGTGSGCMAVAIAHYVPAATVCATDLSPAAVTVARRNADRLGVAERVAVAEGSLLEPAPGPFDLVCANLPYLPPGHPFPPEVLAQPHQALFAGARGSELVVALLEQAPAKLAGGGEVLAEVDPLILGDVVPVAERLYAGHRLHRDLGGHERVLEVWTES
ncbi:MAG: peptide chain release factor N(5)-glutamine methyltransferase [Chloroflexota bacterium]